MPSQSGARTAGGENGQPASDPMNRAGEAVGEAAQGARELVVQNPGTVSTAAILFGLAGFAIGLACGQAASRPHQFRR